MYDPPAPPLYEQPDIRARRWFLLGIMCLSLVLVVMSVSGLNVALPTLQRDLDATATQLQWIVDAYAIVFAGLLLTAGAVGDRFGRKGALLAGLAVFGSASLLGAFADAAWQVIAVRAAMGIGAAFIMPATLSLLTSIFPPAERGTAIAVWAGFAGAGGAIGPIVVGGLLEGFWWGSAFLVNVVVVIGVMIAVARFSPSSRDDDVTPLDPVGALLSLVGLAALLFGIIEGPEQGWTSALVIGGFAVGVIGLVGFVVWEQRTAHPMLPMDFFGDRRFSAGSGVITLAFFSMFGFFFLFTQYLQFVRGYSPLEAGLATLPLAVTLVIVSPRSAGLAERLGQGVVIGVGFVLMVAGFVVMGLVSPDTAYLGLVAGLVLLGAGMGITVAPATGGIMASVPLGKAGVGSAVNDTTREVGGALGIAVLGSVASSAYRDGISLDQAPAEIAEVAGESIGAASVVAAEVGGPVGEALAGEAGRAFTDAFNAAMLVSASVAIVAGIAAVAALGRRRTSGEPARQTAEAVPLDADGVP
ncbi:MAG: DHA2 family efflux MFS transporter permease subunit [Actinomycetota bacterium]